MKNSNPIIIAEVGVNHNGSKKLLRQIIKKVSNTGVNYIKFQAFITENIVIKNSPKANYQRKIKSSQFNMLKKYELNFSDYDLIHKTCKKKRLKPLFSVFDIDSLNFLKKYKIDTIKIPSGEITNKPLLSEIGKLKLKIILSTGMSTIKEIKNAIDTLIKNGSSRKKISILHCHSNYPSKFVDLNLNNILTFKKKFKCKVGFSDHSLGGLASIVAASLGAQVIEKHITLDNKLYGPDHSSSLEIKKLKGFVKNIRNTKIILGKNKIKRTNIENLNKKIVRKSLVAKKNIKKGEVFSKINITSKRPGTGLSPFLYDKVLGLKSKFNFKTDQLIRIK
ncbi:N-acetylneuraminate synthase family protein [Pelagibacterales bacterium SAG-MED47]|nr:N-acetylneuraminate synthase family protein [Pelagibacterales bacterium SAG-MED47]